MTEGYWRTVIGELLLAKRLQQRVSLASGIQREPGFGGVDEAPELLGMLQGVEEPGGLTLQLDSLLLELGELSLERFDSRLLLRLELVVVATPLVDQLAELLEIIEAGLQTELEIVNLGSVLLQLGAHAAE